MAKPFEFIGDPGEPHPRHAAAPARPARAARSCSDELEELQATIKPSWSRSSQSDAKLRGGHQGRARRGAREVRRRRAAREITLDAGDLDDLDLIEDEEVVVVLSHKGYVKTVAVDAFRKQGRGGKGVRGGEPDATRTTSSTCSPPPRTRTCCSSRTAAGSTGCARTRSR